MTHRCYFDLDKNKKKKKKGAVLEEVFTCLLSADKQFCSENFNVTSKLIGVEYIKTFKLGSGADERPSEDIDTASKIRVQNEKFQLEEYRSF